MQKVPLKPEVPGFNNVCRWDRRLNGVTLTSSGNAQCFYQSKPLSLDLHSLLFLLQRKTHIATQIQLNASQHALALSSRLVYQLEDQGHETVYTMMR